MGWKVERSFRPTKHHKFDPTCFAGGDNGEWFISATSFRGNGNLHCNPCRIALACRLPPSLPPPSSPLWRAGQHATPQCGIMAGGICASQPASSFNEESTRDATKTSPTSMPNRANTFRRGSRPGFAANSSSPPPCACALDIVKSRRNNGLERSV